MTLEKSYKDPNQKIGVAIAGLGFGEKVHLPSLKTNKDFKPIALWHPRKEKIDEASNKYNLKGYSNWQHLINDPSIHAIIIATPPEVRYKLAIEALNSNKHLLLEKPIALNRKEALEIEKSSLKRKLSVAVNFEYRAVPLFMQAKKMIEEGAIGKPWLIKYDWLMSSRANINRPWNWYSETEKGGGVIGALGTHSFDLLEWLFGEITSVSSFTSTSIKERKHPVNNLMKSVTSEDICMAHMEICDIESRQIVPAQLTLSAVSRNGRGCWIEVYGEDGTLILGSDNQTDYVHGFGLWFAEKNKTINSIQPSEDFIFSKTWEDGRVAPVARIQQWWGESIIRQKPVIPGIHEGVVTQKVVDKIIESSKSGMKLKINDF
ncbi:Gfo/Idh/MocA family protein [Prochlorococcus marinus]|uniref:Gfo/Idh/MocA family protein n=1 Tax=Prochlorococcus marinus TaxID=1219 RepID=UPI0022B37845|nr:Gfo/Idh/MocA family oxidoreductase [Prochlorococcus marinus]